MSSPRMMSVQVQTGQIRSTPSFLGNIVAEASYAQQVQVLEEKGGWMRVAVPGASMKGWMHGSALSTKRIVLQAGAEDVQKAATSGEIALAGKGFNKQVEDEYRAQNKDIDFTWIDRMQKTSASMQQLQQFAKDGQLNI
jgi:SH3-like domain-containing protein